MSRIGKCNICHKDIKKGERAWVVYGGTNKYHYSCKEPDFQHREITVGDEQ